MTAAARRGSPAAGPDRLALLLALLPPPGRLGQRRERYPTYAPDVEAAAAGTVPETRWTDGWVPDVASDGGPGAVTVGAVETLWQIGVAVQRGAGGPAAALARLRPMGTGPVGWFPVKWLQATGRGEDADLPGLTAACLESVPGLRAAEVGWQWHGLPGGIGGRKPPPGPPDLFAPAMAELVASGQPADFGRRRWLLGALAAL